MAYLRSRKFCCCLPVRFGVFVISLLGILGGALVSAAGWIQIAKPDNSLQLSSAERISLWLETVIYTLLAILSLFGFIGVFTKNRRFISTYATSMFIHWGFSVGTGAFYLFQLFHKQGDQDVTNCENGDTGDIKHDLCKGALDVVKAVSVTVLTIVWLIELYGCIIVSNYADQLADEEEFNAAADRSAAPAPYAFTVPQNGYGYSKEMNAV